MDPPPEGLSISSEPKKESKEQLLSEQNKPENLNKEKANQKVPTNQVDIQKPTIKPIQITEKKPGSKDSPTSSPLLPQTKKKAKQQLQIRRIPSDLYESYDQMTLTVNTNGKLIGKDNIISPIKLKEKKNPNLTNKKTKQNQKLNDSPKETGQRPQKILKNLKDKQIEQELLVSLPVVEGYCQLRTESSQLFETKFIINKNTICFQTFKKIDISAISKVKFIEKDEKQITVKITYESEGPNSKQQNFLLSLLTESFEAYFAKSYEFFANIILRKLLLMKLHINELNERYEGESPAKSPQSSPLSSAMTLPSVLPRKASQATQTQNQGPMLFESNLYKRSTFFNTWEKKYFTLNTKQLQSYSSPPINGEKHKSSTQMSKTSQIWTRFELTYGYLVIKMWQSKIEKIQIGIPLCDFTNEEGKNNWLYGLSKNILWGKQSSKEEKINNTIAN